MNNYEKILRIWEVDICTINKKLEKEKRDKVSSMLQKAMKKYILKMESAKMKLSQTG